MIDRLTQLQIFMKVAQLHSFQQAANQLGLPRATVSYAIQQLEQYFGVKLLQRTTRRVSITPDGERLLPECESLLLHFETLEQMIRPHGEDLQGLIKIDMPCRIAHQLVIPALPSLLQQHPMLQVHVSSSDHQTDIVQAGFDCLLRVGALANNRLIAKPIGQLAMINCVSPSYVQRYGQPYTLDQLTQHYMVHYSSTTTPYSTFDYQNPQDHSMHRLSMLYQISVNNTEAYISAALAGFGIIQVPRFDVQALLDSGQLIEILANTTSAPLPINLIYPSREYLPRRLSLIMQWLKDLIQPYCLQA
ncbi:MAG: LysR family transcriptional regulator [Pseudomonadota bacterium]|nr:LysR family transcriptional regulator [Pseudomonadota bacterium]